MKKCALSCCLLLASLGMLAYGDAKPSRASFRVATQAEIDNDDPGFPILRSTAKELSKSDIVLVVVFYKSTKTDKGTSNYGRVVQSLRGGIPVEALVKWHGRVKLPVGSPPETSLYSGCELVYVLASSKKRQRLPKAAEDFQPADEINDGGYLPGAYDLGDSASYFPMTESCPGRAVKRLLHIEPARVVEESDAARFHKEPVE